MICTFFGHRDAPESIFPVLQKTLTLLITQNPSAEFYVGNHGNFDRMAIKALHLLAKDFPHIKYAVVLAYFPQNNHFSDNNYPTLFPEGLEASPPRFAIDKRNRWMLKKSDTVITCVKHPFGGAAKYKAMAGRLKKIVIELNED